jgi:hypothetical protein
MDMWIVLLTKCPIIILILALGAAIGISILGLVASNWSLTIDSDFAGYMTADSTLKLEEDMLAGARLDQSNSAKVASGSNRRLFLEKATMMNNKEKISRFLTETNSTGADSAREEKVTQSRTWIELDIYYEALKPNEETGIFYEEALEEIKEFEERLRAFKGYEDFCLKRYRHKGYKCDLPTSPINIFYGTVDLVGGNTILSQTNGT